MSFVNIAHRARDAEAFSERRYEGEKSYQRARR
jgi:hypothetical protein